MSRDLLIRGATVLSVDPAVGDLLRGDVLVRDDVIAAAREHGLELGDERSRGEWWAGVFAQREDLRVAGC